MSTRPHTCVRGCPKSTASSLRLRGELLYVEMLVAAEQKYALHFDVETATGDIVRLSLGNIYSEAKTYRNAAGTVVLAPLPASLASRWSVVAIDIAAVLGSFEQTNHLQYTCLRAVQCCASMVLRNVFVATRWGGWSCVFCATLLCAQMWNTGSLYVQVPKQ